MTSKDKAFIDKLKTINVGIAPPWAAPLSDLKRLPDDADASVKIMEESERLKKVWTRNPVSKWAAWEKGRKEAAMKNKPEWIKRGATAKDREDAIHG